MFSSNSKIKYGILYIFVVVSLQELYNWPGLSVNFGVLVTQDTVVWAPLYFMFIQLESLYMYFSVIVLYVI